MASTSRSFEPVIQVDHVSKAYKVFRSRYDNFLDALGIGRLMPWHRGGHRDFWALRDIDLTLLQGQRIGLIGRNGAGKTTLLKLITGNLRPTTGTIKVKGKIQALIDAGTGFHPDFTGKENVRASLTYQGFSPRELADATREIEDFTELGEFMDRPFRTYSSGMQARLIFATATAVNPKILVIDEILGAGDAYFIGKSSERIQRLVDSGASILLVSHSMDHIARLCDTALWLDRGRIVMQGNSLDVVTAYGKFVHELEDRRQRARNTKVNLGHRLARERMDHYSDSVVLRFVVPPGSSLKASAVRWFRGEELEAEVRVGDAQDSDSLQDAYVVISGGDWSRPHQNGGSTYRALRGGPAAEATGSVGVNLFALDPRARYVTELSYESTAAGPSVEVWQGGVNRQRLELPVTPGGMTTTRFEIALDGGGAPASPQPAAGDGMAASTHTDGAMDRKAAGPTRWPGEGSLQIEDVRLLDREGAERAVFRFDDEMRVRLAVRAVRGGSYPVRPAAVLYRIDGIKLFSHVGPQLSYIVEAGDVFRVELDLGPLNIGDGHYAFAIAIYRTLDPVGASVWYDLIDRDYRFEVTGARPFAGIYEHPGEWKAIED